MPDAINTAVQALTAEGVPRKDRAACCSPRRSPPG